MERRWWRRGRRRGSTAPDRQPPAACVGRQGAPSATSPSQRGLVAVDGRVGVGQGALGPRLALALRPVGALVARPLHAVVAGRHRVERSHVVVQLCVTALE